MNNVQAICQFGGQTMRQQHKNGTTASRTDLTVLGRRPLMSVLAGPRHTARALNCLLVTASSARCEQRGGEKHVEPPAAALSLKQGQLCFLPLVVTER